MQAYHRCDSGGALMGTPSLQHANGSRQLGRSALALISGILVGVILSVGTDFLMVSLKVLPPLGSAGASDRALLLATLYRTVYGILGSFVTARLAPNHPMGHALTLGTLGFLVSIAGAVATWNRQPSLGPHWYPIALVVLAIPTAWAGGKLRLMQLRRNKLSSVSAATG
jgi:hypothetical protein